jgi:acetyltransferase
MITSQLLHPASIVVVGASNNVHKPGGAILKNLLSGGYTGELRAVNPKETEVQGVAAFADVKDIPDTDLAILAIPAALCPDAVEMLAAEKQVKAFIILSAGFGEETHEGAVLEDRILETVNRYGASLIGPNCIGFMNSWHHSVFSQPIPQLHPQGVDLISSSGATAVFILESAVTKGLQFNSVWSVGNAKQIGVEDVLQYMDEHFNPEADSRIKLLYIESIGDPDRLLFHASSLIKKGCKIAAIKAGSSESGSRAASSHTGAIASSDSAVEALFRKAGIVRCYSREELTTVGCIFTLPELKGKNFAIITHAGGPGVMLTDALSKGGLNVPKLEGPVAEELKGKLFPGAAVGNPIDILATGTPEHLRLCLEYCEEKFDNIDAVMAIFGTPGLVTMFEMYDVLHEKMQHCKKPIFPILPSINTAGAEVAAFLAKGHVNFADEVTLGTALSRIMNAPRPANNEIDLFGVDVPRIRRIIDSARQRVAVTANAELTMMYWHIGERINREVLGNQRAEYGKRIVSMVATQLQNQYGTKGFEIRNIRRMMQFAQKIPKEQIVSQLATQLTWSHIIEVLPVKAPLAVEFYLTMSSSGRWGRNRLRKEIDSMLFERTAIATQPDELIKKELADLPGKVR